MEKGIQNSDMLSRSDKVNGMVVYKDQGHFKDLC